MQRKWNMVEWKRDVLMSAYKKAVPVLSFPSVQKLGCTVKEMIFSSDLQAEGMKYVADVTPSLASLSMMNLTVEAEAFGAEVLYPENEIPSTVGNLVKTMEDAENLKVPKVGDGLTQVYIDATKKAAELITDRPVFAGIIGPFTLAGRLMGLAPLMIAMKKKPDLVKLVMRKATDFIIEYAKAYKEQTGCCGFVMAEPSTGLISNKMNVEFSEPYSKEVIDAVQDEYFIVIFHNCGETVMIQTESLARLGAEGYHFGNIIDMKKILPLMPKDRLIMGNTDPSKYLCLGTPDGVREAAKKLLEECAVYPNYVPSTGCDTAPIANWDCIHAYFDGVNEFYAEHGIEYDREKKERAALKLL